jgi:hypothetical protein
LKKSTHRVIELAAVLLNFPLLLGSVYLWANLVHPYAWRDSKNVAYSIVGVMASLAPVFSLLAIMTKPNHDQ